MPTSRAVHEHPMQLADQPEAHRQLSNPLQTILHSLDVVGDLHDIRGRPPWTRGAFLGCLEQVEVSDVRLCAFDTRREHRLAAHERLIEQTRTRDRTTEPRELTKGEIRTRECLHKRRVIRDRRRQGRRHESAMLRLYRAGRHDSACGGMRELGSLHRRSRDA
jgi:hypothetical protein